MLTYSDDAFAWRFALHGWFQLHDERGGLLGMYGSTAEAHDWVRRSGGRLRLFRLDYWIPDQAARPGETGPGRRRSAEGPARVQRRWRLRKTERGSLEIVAVPLKGRRRKGGAR